jgi:radical SAM superfamily enzyme YgiQ (UPF0313 family)
MRVLLINPPSFYLENDSAYPPMGLLYLAAVIEDMGHDVELLDLALFDEIEAPLLKALDKIDLVGISCVTPNVPVVDRIIGFIHPSISVIVGGPHPTFEPFKTFNELGVSILVGEGEEAIREVLRDLQYNKQIRDLYGGKLVNLKSVLRPLRKLIDLKRYYPGGVQGSPIYTSRGCPFSCAFCSKISGSYYRRFSLSIVLEEISEVIQDFGISHIVFGDDDIGLNPDLYQLIDLMKVPHRMKNVTYRLNLSARFRDDQIFETAFLTGCTEISFGVESGSQKILDSMNKNLTVQFAEEVIKRVKDYNIKSKIYLMCNFPGETEETIEETIKFVERTKPDSVFISAFVPLPGSDIYNNPLKYGITWVSDNWEDYYTVGKNRNFGHCFETHELKFKEQEKLYNMLLKGVGLI